MRFAYRFLRQTVTGPYCYWLNQQCSLEEKRLAHNKSKRSVDRNNPLLNKK
jgi:hypothetical protein